MQDKKLKHLEFIQNVITRMGLNSFYIKGWAITLISALFALAAKDANVNYIAITYTTILLFWGLDAYYLSLEKDFRNLYDNIRILDETKIDFSMDTSLIKAEKDNWLNTLISKTILGFYLVLTVLVSIATIYLI